MAESTKEAQVKSKIIRENHLEFLFYELYEKGIELPQDQIELLKKHKYIKDDVPRMKRPSMPRSQKDLSIKGEYESKADEIIDIIESNEEEEELIVQTQQEYEEEVKQNENYRYVSNIDIQKSDWMPRSSTDHSKDFVRWIDSINAGFQSMIKYKPFLLYKQQASDWKSENKSINDYDNNYDKADFVKEDMRRCRDNTLYAMNKYLNLKEGDMNSGSRLYDAKPVHEVMCFMLDCGYSLAIGKPRQIAATSTIGGIAMFKILLNKNLFIKFITMDKESGEEIFEDKIKYPFSELPSYMKPEVSNDRDNLFKLGGKMKKQGKIKPPNSKIQVVAPSYSAINGGSPNIVMVDEAGYIKILGKMIKEARPTMYWQNPATGKMELKRQIIIWGTGGEMDKAGKAFEEEYTDALRKWQSRNFQHAIIPIFFDWSTRPGITKEVYEKEKSVYTVEGPEKEAKMVQFRQAYPRTVSDMFLTSSKTLVGIDYIDKKLEHLRKIDHKLRPQRGFFEPIYDENKPETENSDVPFKITGARFIPTGDDDDRASALIFHHPVPNWVDRYYQGTDPISSDNGYSNMSTSIFDAHYKTLSCVVDYRDSNHKHTFLQCMLAGIYYKSSTQIKIPELVEANIGTAYMDYQEAKGYESALVQRLELPPVLQGGSGLHGLDNRGNRNRLIIDKLYEFIVAYGDRIYIDRFFEQLKTFHCTVTEKGNETWGTSDKRKYFDDVLFSSVFAYICHLTYDHRIPKQITSEHDKFKMKYELKRNAQGNLTRVPKKVLR